MVCKLAEGKGFEPLSAYALAVFKTAALDRSATPPRCGKDRFKPRGAQGARRGERRGSGALAGCYTPDP